MIVCLGCYYNGKKYNNRILSVQGLTWLLDCVQSGLIAIGFSIGVFVKGTRYAWISPYIDPVVMICLVFTIIREPMSVLSSTMLELLDVSTDEKMTGKLAKIISPIFNIHTPSLKIDTILKRKAGRKIFIYIMCKEAPDVTVTQLVELKKVLHEKLTENGVEFFLILGV